MFIGSINEAYIAIFNGYSMLNDQRVPFMVLLKIGKLSDDLGEPWMSKPGFFLR